MANNTIRIDGIDFTVEIVEGLHAEAKKLDGWITYGDTKIKLDSGLSDGAAFQVLWHEVLHGICAQRGIEFGEDDEQIIDSLAHGIVQVLRDNPQLRQL